MREGGRERERVSVVTHTAWAAKDSEPCVRALLGRRGVERFEAGVLAGDNRFFNGAKWSKRGGGAELFCAVRPK